MKASLNYAEPWSSIAKAATERYKFALKYLKLCNH